MYEIDTGDFYKDISTDVRTKFDTSNFLKDHLSGIETGVNKKVIAMFKDEAGRKQIIEFVGLRAKLYSFKMVKANKVHEEKKCKGKKHIIFEDYKKCLLDRIKHVRTMNVIRSHKHDVFIETVNKVALSCEEDKKIICEDGTHTYAHGHFSL